MNQRRAGVILSYLGEGAKILISFIYTPVMLRLLGQSEYGLYQLVFSVVSYLSLLSLGFSSSYLRFYSKAKISKDIDEVAKLNGMFLTIFSILSLVCLLCGFVMVENIEIIFADGLNDSEYSKAKILMSLLVINLALTFPNSVFNCAITAQEKFVFQKSLILIQNIINPFLTLPLLILGYGSVGMVIVTTVITIVVLLLNIYYCIKKLHIRFSFKNFKIKLLKEMWVFTFFIFLNQIIDQVNWSVDKFILGRYSGTNAVAVYGIGGQINSYYLMFSTSISNVFVPKVNRIVAESNDNDILTKLFTKVGRIQFIMMAMILSGFVFVGHSFVNLWAGPEYSDSYYVTLLLIIPVTVPLIQNLGIEIQMAKNKHKVRSIVYFIISIMNIFISIPLVKIWGPSGAALGTAISLFIGNIVFMNWYYHKHIGLDMFFFWKNIISILPSVILPILFGAFVVHFFDIKNAISIICFALIYVIVYSLSIWKFGMNDVEKEIIKNPISKIKKKFLKN